MNPTHLCFPRFWQPLTSIMIVLVCVALQAAHAHSLNSKGIQPLPVAFPANLTLQEDELGGEPSGIVFKRRPLNFQNLLLAAQDSDSSSSDSNDPMTNLGGQTIVLLMLVLVKVFAQFFGIDDQNDGEINKKSTFRLHEAFNYPFQKMMGQGT